MSLLRLLILFVIGFTVWSLALARTFALLKQQRLLVCSLIFIEEIITLWIGVWLARAGSISDAISCALGGTVAALIVMSMKRFRENA